MMYNAMRGPGDYEMDSGQYKGLRLREIILEPSGLSYLKWMENNSHGFRLKCVRAYLKELRSQGARPSPSQSSPQTPDLL